MAFRAGRSVRPAASGPDHDAPAPAARWERTGDVLRLVFPDGDGCDPTAAEVFGAEFKDRIMVRGHEVIRPSAALPTIRFVRYPLQARLSLRPPSADLSVPAACSIQLTDGARVFSMPAQSATYLLTTDEWLPISHETLDDVFAVLKSADIAEPGPLTLRQYFKLLRQDASVPLLEAEPSGSEDHGLVPAEAPPLTAQLYPYQSAGLARLLRLAADGFGALLADEMGLGKTIQAIGLIALEVPRTGAPALVLSPATLLENWRREIQRFAPQLDTVVHRGGGRTGFPSTLKGKDVVLTSYETAVRDLGLLKMIKWSIVVLDEAQAIKNPEIRRTTAVKQLSRGISLAMTGTPVENRLQDLWSIIDFVEPGFLGSLADFSGRFSDTTHDAAELEPLIRPLVVRRRIAEVAQDLPPRIEIPQAIELSADGAVEYEEIRQATIRQYGPAAGLVALTKLRIFCTHPVLVRHSADDPVSLSTKYSRLIEILEEICDRRQKVIIFTSFNEMTDLLVRDLPARLGVSTDFIDGRVPVESRQERVDVFSRNPGAAVLVLNPRAAGTGLNITAATHVIHYNLEWNPAVEDQATARAHRIGQTFPVTVHRLFHASTVEEIINDRMSRKRDLASAAVVGAELDAADLADLNRAFQVSPLARQGQS